MIRIHPLFRFVMMLGMVLVLSFSFPVSSNEAQSHENESSQGAIEEGITMMRPHIRQHAPNMLKPMLSTQLLSLLFMIYLLESLQLPSYWLPFKHCIMLLLRRLFLDPIKYTSTFVSKATLSVL